MTVDPIVEMLLSGSWTDITSDVYQRQRIKITRGRRDEGSKTDTGRCQLTINNRNGKYSPRNPESSLYGQIGRNTPVRVRQGSSDVALNLPGLEGSYSSTPDDASLDITGDIDIRVELTHATWRPNEFTILAAKNGSNLAWTLRLLTDGKVELAWSDGSSRFVEASTSSVPSGSGRLAVRVTLDVSNSSSVYEATFYTAPEITGTWTQLGSAVTGSSATSIASVAADLTLGAVEGGGVAFTNGSVFDGLVHAFELRDGINGTVVADVGFGSDVPGDSTFTDDAGLTWTVHDLARLTDLSVRMTGEVSEWPPRWDVTGSDVYTPIEAAGILRRLGNVNSPLRSPLYRGTLATLPVAYWPMEDGEDSTTVASGLDGGSPLSIVRSPTLADFDGFIASEPVPTMQTGQFTGVIPDYPNSDVWQTQFMLHVPSGGISQRGTLLEMTTTGTARRWQLRLTTAGDFQVLVLSETGATLYDSTIVFDVNGEKNRVEFRVTQNGSDIDWRLGTLEEGDNVVAFVSDTIVGADKGQMQSIVLGAASGLEDVAIGHVTARGEVYDIGGLGSETNAYQGEAAARRIERLCAEQGIPLAITGRPDDTAALGPQSPDTLLNLVREAAQADLGVLGELRDQVGLHYRCHQSLYNRLTQLMLDYANGDVSPPLKPTEDDRNTVNDVVVKRRDGSSSRAVKKTGPLSVQPPPDGVGRYDTSVTLNLDTDDQTTQQANWRMHLGTVNELRYPVVTVNLSRNPGLREAIKSLDQGDRLTIQNAPDWLPPGEVELTIEGSSEELDRYWWQWSANTSPARSHDVFELNSPTLGRLASEGSELNAAIDSMQTTFDVAVTAGELWTTDSADFSFDIDVGGEVMTVSGISGTSSPQTFTVTRSVNGIVKSHSSGTAVQLYQPGVLALGQSGADL